MDNTACLFFSDNWRGEILIISLMCVICCGRFFFNICCRHFKERLCWWSQTVQTVSCSLFSLRKYLKKSSWFEILNSQICWIVEDKLKVKVVDLQTNSKKEFVPHPRDFVCLQINNIYCMRGKTATLCDVELCGAEGGLVLARLVACGRSHQLTLLVVGQDLGDVPVSGGDGLQRVRTGVGLWGGEKKRRTEVQCHS